MEAKIFLFDQRNSGGSFVVDDKLCHRVIIETENELLAIAKAEDMGIYFNGVEDGMDCACCGDRWCYPDKKKFPLDFGNGQAFKTVEEYAQHLANEYGLTTPDARIFYSSGEVLEIFKQQKNA